MKTKRKMSTMNAIFKYYDEVTPIFIYQSSFKEKWNSFITKDLKNTIAMIAPQEALKSTERS